MSGMIVKLQRPEDGDGDRKGGRAFTFVLIAAGVVAAGWMFLESSGAPPVEPVGLGGGVPCGECTCAPTPTVLPATLGPELLEAGPEASAPSQQEPSDAPR